MRLIPTKAQWRKWTLPSKASYAGCAIGIVALILAAILAAWSNHLIQVAGQPQLRVTYTAKPYLRYEVYDRDGMEFSYEISVTNSGHNPAMQLRYTQLTQSLIVDGEVVSKTEGRREKNPPPERLVSGGHYSQIFKMSNTNISTQQIANCIAKYESGDLAIVLELEIQYVDGITDRKYLNKEINKIHKDHVEIIESR